jgi:VanZ family protein
MRPSFIMLTAFYCWAIFASSSNSEPPKVDLANVDKIVHFILFGGLAATVSIGLRHADRLPGAKTQFWLPILFTVCYAISDEAHQIFVPNRSFSLADIAADATGALAAQAFLCFYIWRFRWNLSD